MKFKVGIVVRKSFWGPHLENFFGPGLPTDSVVGKNDREFLKKVSDAEMFHFYVC